MSSFRIMGQGQFFIPNGAMRLVFNVVTFKDVFDACIISGFLRLFYTPLGVQGHFTREPRSAAVSTCNFVVLVQS